MNNDKYQQFFTYLREYYKLRETTISDLITSNKYEDPVWLYELEACKGVKSTLLGQEEDDAAQVLSIVRPKAPVKPQKPAPDEQVERWLEEEKTDETAAPRVRESVTEVLTNEEGQEKVIEVFLANDPKLSRRVTVYLSQHDTWRQKTEQYLSLKQEYDYQQRIYSNLFRAQNKIDAFSETWEFVLGLGVFYWKSKKGKIFRRPLITVPLEMEVQTNGTLTVRIAVEDKLLRVENDFVADQAVFTVVEATRILRRYTQNTDADVWELIRTHVPIGLESFASRLSDGASYLSGKKLPERAPEVPIVSYAPVFVLRQRSQRSYTVLFDNILSYLNENGAQRLPLLDRIVHGAGFNDTPAGRKPENWGWKADRIDLPKLSNDEQLRIVEAVSQRDIVVVQGPPGTGKSHSIANILTYLLGQGKKVLITAKTDQALQALQQHIPQSFADLIIFFLRGAEKQGNELVASVNSLQRLVETYDKHGANARIIELDGQLEAFHRERAALLNSIRELEQSEYRPCTLNGGYRNRPLVELVEQILAERSQYEWLQPEETLLEDQLGGTEYLQQWLDLYARPELRKFVPGSHAPVDLSLLPDPNQLTTLRQMSEELAMLEVKSWEWDERTTLSSLEETIEKWLAFPALPKSTPWHYSFVEDYNAGKSNRWQQRLNNTDRILQELTALDTDELYRDYEFSIPDDIGLKQLRADIRVVKNSVEEGTRLTGLLSRLFIPGPVKQRSYIYESCLENGYPCTTLPQINRLRTHAEALRCVTELKEIWGEYPLRSQRLADQKREFAQRLAQLRDLLHRYPSYLDFRTRLVQQLTCRPAELENLHVEHQLQQVVARYRLKDEVRILQQQHEISKSEVEKVLGGNHRCKEVLTAMDTLEVDDYSALLAELTILNDRAAKYATLTSLEDLIDTVFPDTLARLRQSSLPELPQPREVNPAVYWRHADTLLNKRFAVGLDRLYGQVKQVDDRIRQAAKDRLKVSATQHFLKGLRSIDAFSSGLSRWSQAARYSSGSSKRAFRSRIQAKEQLRRISQDIPCWIMPLYKLADTLGPEPELFDVVIVDEASQLGPEASFLQYITKRIIVVGDDQQTAPETIGVKDDQVNSLIRAHLTDVADAKFYQKEYSFFDHASANAGRSITLREHFRCMPEIIEFSNQICYQPIGTPLIPLKQYGGDRLPPLQSHFVQDGSASKSQGNVAEAQAIVKHIESLIADNRYDGLTIGIITLLGDAQVKEIDAQLDQAYGSRISISEKTKRRIRCGKPADFQGDERDAILLSLVIAPDYNFSAVTSDNDKRRFNVAMSRAKQQVVLFHSVRLEDLNNPNCYRYKLLHYFRHQHVGQSEEELTLPTGPRNQPPGGVFDSWFEVDVCREIRAKGYRVEPQFRVGPYRIDLVVHLDGGGRIAVECDGDYWHGEDQLESDTRRQLQLERAGWTFYRLLYSDYRYRSEASLANLWKLLEQYTIVPSPVNTLDTVPSQSPPVKQAPPVPKEAPPPAVSFDPLEDGGQDEESILVFTNQARVYYSQVNAIATELPEGEQEVYRTQTSDYRGYVLFGYENGRVDKVAMEAFITQRIILNNAFSLDAKLIFIKHYWTDEDLVALSSKNKVIVFNTSQLELHTTRAGKGDFVFRRGTTMTALRALQETNLTNPGYYRKTTLNVAGLYKKINDKFQ